ncbi:MAG: hypothetical protein NTW68_03815 [candidate division NC10 bacterium]|nr:hypothetical protein [candidate division NC10 bacterium]
MNSRKLGWVVFAAIIGFTIWLSTAVFAADCGMPVAAPKYEGNEEWKWKNDKGREWVNRVIGVEGETTAIEWANKNIGYYNKDWVIERVKRGSGEVVDKQGAGTFIDIGQKVLDFPLELGKQWRWSFVDTPSGGYTGLVTYTHWVKVAACEDVQTPAGTYPALKIEIDQRSSVGGSRNGTYYLWWAPSVKNVIKRQYVPSRWWGDKVTDYELIWSGKR